MKKSSCQTRYSSSLFDIYEIHNEKPNDDRTGWLNHYFINLPREGYYSYYHPRESYTVYNGVVHLQNRHTESRVLNDSSKFVETCIKLKESVIEEFKGKDFIFNSGHNTDSGPFRFPTDTIPGNSKIDYLHSLLYTDLSDSRMVDKLAMDEVVVHLLKIIFDELDKYANHSTFSKKELDKHLNIVERGKEFILNNFRDNIELSDISSHAYSSPYHFSRIFKQFTSISPYQYLIKVRLNHSVQLLLNTNDPVTQISFDSGFNNLSHFIATFGNRFDRSPLQYRKKHR